MSKNLNFQTRIQQVISEFPWPLYQNEFKCSAFDTKMIFRSHHFHKKGCATGLIFHLRLLPEFLNGSHFGNSTDSGIFGNCTIYCCLQIFESFGRMESAHCLQYLFRVGLLFLMQMASFTLRSNHLGSTVNTLIFSRSIMCPA